MSIVESNSAVVQLNWSLKDGNVVVTPRDEDRFVIKLNRAISILQQGEQAEKFGRQFNLLLRMLAEWLKEHPSAVTRAFLTDRDGALAFVVVRSSCDYNDAFEDELSELDYRLANDPDLDLISMSVIGLPLACDAAVSSFIDPLFALEYVGNGT